MKLASYLVIGLFTSVVLAAVSATPGLAQRLGNDSQDFFRLGGDSLEREIQRLRLPEADRSGVLKVKPTVTHSGQPSTQPLSPYPVQKTPPAVAPAPAPSPVGEQPAS